MTRASGVLESAPTVSAALRAPPAYVVGPRSFVSPAESPPRSKGAPRRITETSAHPTAHGPRRAVVVPGWVTRRRDVCRKPASLW